MIKQAFSFNPKFYEGEKRKETIAETVDFWTLKKNTSKITARLDVYKRQYVVCG